MNWPRFLDQHRIEYITSGPNVGRNHINIHCIWCGASDPSYHLGISLEGRGYHCWRNDRHSGYSPIRLIQALIKCSYEEAQRIAGVTTTINVNDNSFGAYVSNLMRKEIIVEERTLQFPSEIKPITANNDTFISYLRTRKYSKASALELIQLYDLRYALSGPFAWRFIFPIYSESGCLLTWTGRAIGRSNTRYKALSPDPKRAKAEGLPQALESIHDCLWNFDQLIHNEFSKLILVEGPFDSLRFDFVGHPYGVRSTCLFGKSKVSDSQIDLLDNIRGKFNNLVVCLDPGTDADALRITQQLAHLNPKFIRLSGRKDPGAMTTQETKEFLHANLG